MPSTTILSENQWRTVFGSAALVISYLLVQEDVPIEGWFKVILGGLNILVAALSPSRLAGTR